MSDLRRVLNSLELDPELLEKLTSEMGQGSSSYTVDNSIQPGTYRIVHVKTRKVLQPDEEEDQELVISDRQYQGACLPGRREDHWYIQRSGDGYIFKHCLNRTYISIALGSGFPYETRATKYPATWVIYSKGGGDSECIIVTASTHSRVMALHSGSNNDGADGDALLVSPLYKDHDECWRLERIGHSSGGNSSTEEINQLNLQLKRIKKEAKKRESELNQVKDELSEKELECDSHSTQLTEAISELKLVKHELSEMELERDGLSTQLAEANTEKNEAKLGLIRAQEELDWKTAKLAEQEEELAEKESELVRKDAELTGVKSQLEAKEEEPIGKEDQLVHMSDQLNNKEEELSRAQKVIGEKDEEIGKPIERLFTNLKEREILRRMERISAENRIGLGKDHELSDKEEVPKRIQMEHAVNPRLDKKSSETASQSSGRSRAGTSFYSTGVDVKLADLGWDFDDSE